VNNTCILCLQFFDWYSIREKVSNSRNDLYENFEKRGEEETKSMPHAPVISGCLMIITATSWLPNYVYSVSTVFRLIQYKREGKQLHFHISRHIAHLGWETPVVFLHFLPCLHMALSYQTVSNVCCYVFSAVYISRQNIPEKIFGAHLGFSLQVINS
jgi:hypothetical protein